MIEEEYIRKAVRNVMEKLADNPDEMLSLSNLQEKYNNLLVEKIELQQENQQLKEVIEEVRKSIEDYQEYIEEAKEMYSDLDDDNIVKASCMQLLNNQMVRNYEVLQILEKVGVKDV